MLGPERGKGGRYRYLLAQEIEVVVAVCEIRLRCVEFVGEEGFGFGEGVGEHYVGLVRPLACILLLYFRGGMRTPSQR